MSLRPMCQATVAATALTCLVSPTSLQATELRLDGYYRARFHMTDNLFLQRDVTADPQEGQPGSDSPGFWFDHRMRIAPELRVNDYLSAYFQVDLFDNQVWGTDPVTGSFSSLYDSSSGQAQTLGSSANLGDNISVKRAWAEAYTPIGRFKVGRSGQSAGVGMYFNDGNDWDSDSGDTVDRAQFMTRLGPFYVLGGFDQVYEGNTDLSYDGRAASLGVAYRSEVASASLLSYTQFDQTYPVVPGAAIQSTEGGSAFFVDATHNDIVINNLDLWAKGVLGPATLEAEFLYRFGRGDMTLLPTGSESPDQAVTLSGVSLSQFGLVSRAGIDKGPATYSLEYGMASGDDAPNDYRFTTFTFDPNYHVGLILFRQSLPTAGSSHLADGESANGNTPVTADAVSNAIYLKPAAQVKLRPQLTADVAFLAAWTHKENEENNSQKLYGYEVDLGVTGTFWQNLTLRGRGAVFLPGLVYVDTDLDLAHDEPALAAEIQAFMQF